MVARADGYYRTSFWGERGVTQGNSLSPTIFKVVVDKVAQHRVTRVIPDSESTGELGQEGRHKAALFYADNIMVASSDPVWMQGAFTALVGLFDRVVLRTNVGKTVGMVCHPCQAAGNLTMEAYERRITGMGKSYRGRLRDQVACRDCGEMLSVGSLLSYVMNQHVREAGRRQQWTTPAAGRGAQSYRMSFPAKGGPQKCLVEGCLGRVATRTAIRVHFVHWHVLDTLVILEERNFPHPRCALCDMQFPRRKLNGQHQDTAQCLKGAERKRRRLAEAETRENS